MECNNCGNQKAHAIRMVWNKKEGILENCDICGGVSPSGVYLPDVYWAGPGYHPALVDGKNKPIFLESRRHKAQVMREQNAREAGDFYHGQRGSENAHSSTQIKTPNPNVLRLKKMFSDHQKSISH